MSLELTPDELEKLWKNAEPTREDQTWRQNYYDGKHWILGRREFYAGQIPKTNRVANWSGYIVNRFLGLLTSEPYQVTAKEGDEKNEGPAQYTEISEKNDFPALDVELLRLMLAQGSAIELHEFIDDEIKVTGHDPRKWLLLLDVKASVLGAIYRIKVEAGTLVDDKPLPKAEERMWLYDDTTRTEFKRQAGEEGAGATWRPVEDGEIAHEYGRVPVFQWKANKMAESLITNDIIGLNDEYNEIYSAAGDDIRREVDALLAVKGFDAEWLLKNAEVINDTRIIPLGNEATSDAKYLTRRADVEPDSRHLTRTREVIHMSGEVPDVEEITGATGSTSGIALRLKFLPMLQSASSIANNLKAGLRERIDLLNVRLDQVSTTSTIEDMKLIIDFALPANRIEEWDSIGNLDGQVSHKTRLELLTDVDDPEQELARIADEGVGVSEDLTPEQVREQQDAEIARVALEIGPQVQNIMEALSATVLDTIARTGVLDRTAASAEWEENNNG